jgi:hypothetical protein
MLRMDFIRTQYNRTNVVVHASILMDDSMRLTRLSHKIHRSAGLSYLYSISRNFRRKPSTARRQEKIVDETKGYIRTIQ